MAHYGTLLNAFDPVKEEKTRSMYDSFTEYFKDPVMTKTKDVEKYSMYICKLYCLLSNECRYIIVFVDNDETPIGNTARLSELQWISLQTRTMPDQYSLISHGYQPRRLESLNKAINRTNITDEYSTYSSPDYPITVTLLHTKTNTQYQPTGTIVAALETFQTIITINS